MPMLLEVDKESWKYTPIHAALKKLAVTEVPSVWEMTGVSRFLQTNNRIIIPPYTMLQHPIDMRLMGRDTMHMNTAWTIVIGRGSDVSMVEHQSGDGAYWKNIKWSVEVEDNARFTHYRINDDDPFSVVTTKTDVTLARLARYAMVTLTTMTGFTRQEVAVTIAGEGAECDLSGLALLEGKEHLDTTVCVAHNVPHGKSSQFFKNILNDHARGVYQGKIFVAKDAQKTDGYQLSKNLLLSRFAEMDVKPELEIYADDVKCSHGSTTGQLDETPLFYLMSRGIPEDAARRLLLEAFVGDVADKITHEDVRALFDARVKLWLG